jgi:hypothetical protein
MQLYIIIIILICILIIILISFLISNRIIDNFGTIKKNLLFTSAGDNTVFYENWCNNNRNYDIWLVYYGDNDENYNKYSKYVDKIWRKKGSKFQNLYYIYENNRDELMKYERYLITDDDIIISTDDINKLFDISVEYNLWICQASFKSNISRISHKITEQQENNILRYTNFIEVTCPLITKNCLIKLFNVFEPRLIGWGIDYLFIWANGIDVKDKYAVIDSISCINPYETSKKIKSDVREIIKFTDWNNSPKTWTDYSKKIGCPEFWKHIIYQTIKKI